jgi:hypothetical protein
LEKLKKWRRYEVYSNVLPNENWSFGGVVGERAGILKSAILILDLVLWRVDRVELLRG